MVAGTGWATNGTEPTGTRPEYYKIPGRHVEDVVVRVPKGTGSDLYLLAVPTPPLDLDSVAPYSQADGVLWTFRYKVERIDDPAAKASAAGKATPPIILSGDSMLALEDVQGHGFIRDCFSSDAIAAADTLLYCNEESGSCQTTTSTTTTATTTTATITTLTTTTLTTTITTTIATTPSVPVTAASTSPMPADAAAIAALESEVTTARATMAVAEAALAALGDDADLGVKAAARATVAVAKQAVQDKETALLVLKSSYRNATMTRTAPADTDADADAAGSRPDSGLSGGEFAGIIVGLLFAVCLAAAAFMHVVFRWQTRHRPKAGQAAAHQSDAPVFNNPMYEVPDKVSM